MSELKIVLNIKDKGNLTKGSLERMAKQFPSYFEKAIGKSLLVVLSHVQNNLSGKILHVRTGRLRSSFSTEVKRGEDGSLVGKIGSNVKYARIHEFGGVIVPRRTRYLSFRIGDKWVNTKRVVMPARKYFSISFKESTEEVYKIFGETLGKLMQERGEGLNG